MNTTNNNTEKTYNVSEFNQVMKLFTTLFLSLSVYLLVYVGVLKAITAILIGMGIKSVNVILAVIIIVFSLSMGIVSGYVVFMITDDKYIRFEQTYLVVIDGKGTIKHRWDYPSALLKLRNKSDKFKASFKNKAEAFMSKFKKENVVYSDYEIID